MFEGFYNTPGLTYATGFAYEFGLTALVYGFSALALSYILYGIAFLIRRTIKKRYTSVKPGENNDIYLDSSFNELHENLNVSVGKSKDPKRIAVKVFVVLSHLVSWYALLAIAISPSILSGLGVIPVWSSVIITFIIFLIKYVGLVYTLSPSFLNKNKDQANRAFCARFWRRIVVTSTMYKFTLGLFLACSILYSVLVPLATENTCMNFYNQGYGVMYQDFGVSTKFSRHFQLHTVCKKGKICHVYSTLPEDGSTSTILNVHTGVDVTAIQIGYQITGNNDAEILVTPSSYYIDMNEDRGNRYLHSAYLHGLTNNTNYTFNIYFDNKKQQSGQFRTLPSPNMERNFIMAAGGDVGTTEDAKDMTNVLSNYDLDTILIGGDLGYDNGMKSCYYSLDLFLNFFEGLNAQAGRLIPVMVSVGNHDVGFNAFQGTKIDVSENLYFAFFPQHSATDANGTLLYQVPDLADRLSYAYHVVGNTVHLALDSEYVTGYEDQVDFINQVSTQYSSLVKFANFHVPMYPTCFNPAYDDPRTLSIARQVWAPLFEKYKFMSVFENHVHLYKKSHPLVNGTIQDGGVVYFGDGNWGISPDSCWEIPGAVNGNDTGLLEAFNSTRHVWLIDMNSENLIHYAVNETNGLFDKKYPLSVSQYTNNTDL